MLSFICEINFRQYAMIQKCLNTIVKYRPIYSVLNVVNTQSLADLGASPVIIIVYRMESYSTWWSSSWNSEHKKKLYT